MLFPANRIPSSGLGFGLTSPSLVYCLAGAAGVWGMLSTWCGVATWTSRAPARQLRRPVRPEWCEVVAVDDLTPCRRGSGVDLSRSGEKSSEHRR